MKGGRGIIAVALALVVAGAVRSAAAQGEELPIIRVAEPLRVEMTGPPAGAVDVMPDATIVVQFSHPVDCITVSSAGFSVTKDAKGKDVASPEDRIAGSLRCDGRTITFTPDAQLSPDASYTVTVNELIRGSKWERLNREVTFSFATAGEGLHVLTEPAEEWRAADPLP